MQWRHFGDERMSELSEDEIIERHRNSEYIAEVMLGLPAPPPMHSDEMANHVNSYVFVSGGLIVTFADRSVLHFTPSCMVSFESAASVGQPVFPHENQSEWWHAWPSTQCECRHTVNKHSPASGECLIVGCDCNGQKRKA